MWSFPPPLTTRAPPNPLASLQEVEANYLDYDGFVIIMGADTMAYAASAVSFLLQNLAKPLIFTGSIIPDGSPFAPPLHSSRPHLCHPHAPHRCL